MSGYSELKINQPVPTDGQVTIVAGKGANGNAIPLAVANDGTLTVSATLSGTVAANTEYTEGDVDTTFTGILNLAEGPSNVATPLQLTAASNLKVDVQVSALPSGAATGAKQDSQTTLLTAIDGHVDGLEASATSIDGKITACNTGAVVVSSHPGIEGTVAHDGVGASIKPVLAGALAKSSNPTVVSDGDLTRILADLMGRQVVAPFGHYGAYVEGSTGLKTDGSQYTCIAAQGANTKVVVTDFTISVFDTADCDFSIDDGGAPNRYRLLLTKGTWHFPLPGGLVLGTNKGFAITKNAGVLASGYTLSARGYVVNV